ncbi:hypothetical protein [Methylobacterium indicum]|uniref:Growth inhibitor PemK n=1 Tax=Methylobacterium indicum TaxID=1775910 RepID=A0A8H8X0P1_9HYPH|nr:hypothetical protein [Methylobacterium indicum]BCM87673.1 hypothetical protein mvi_61340 [Methylobacterium indicum]
MAVTTETPDTGLVVRYSFLWPREHDRGEREGRKDRPVCLVVPVNVAPGAVVVFPITTQEPLPDRTAVAVPETERRRLKLPGDRPCWIMLDEANGDVMPGSFHLIPLETHPLRYAYGRFSPAFMRVVLRTMAEAIRARQLRMVQRER